MIWYKHNPDWKICGIVYVNASNVQPQRIRQTGLEAHTTILSSATRTTLKQTFISPDSSQLQQPEFRYQFPLYDGVSVVAFTCTIGTKDPRVIRGVVREREEARGIYTEAVQQGQVAGLMEQLPEAADVFTTKLGNIPPATRVVVELTYLGELKHDAQSDGLRLTIPMAIAPRYGSYSDLSSSRNEGGLKITVDAHLPASSQIQSVQSPSHQIAVSIGKTSTAPSSQALSFNQASATLALTNTTCLDKDFILQLAATNLSSPMYDKIDNLISALRIFIKSLPRGASFNICSFGSHFDFLWPHGSRAYTRETVAEAMAHVESFSANYGGTEMYQPLEATFQRRQQQQKGVSGNLEVFLLTDGEIWDQENLLRMVQRHVSESKGAIRVFSLGIGDGASTSLVEGVARAGNGFAQSVVEGEDMSGKVVRMVKGAVFPHVKDYQLEVKYGSDTAAPAASEKSDASNDVDDDDFEVVEKVLDALVIDDPENAAAPPYSETPASTTKTDKQPAKISLFDDSVTISPDLPTDNIPAAKDRFAHLPACPPPSILQTPFEIPPLFPFNRTTIYLLLNNSFPTSKNGQPMVPRSVVLRATSPDGTPLELEVPVTILPEAGEAIHQLAAKKAVQELEEGKGWMCHAKWAAEKNIKGTASDSNSSQPQLLTERYPAHVFEDMVQREAVRLGVSFQVGSGKWCSFVAVEENAGKRQDASSSATSPATPAQQSDPSTRAPSGCSRKRRAAPSPANVSNSASRSASYGQSSYCSAGGAKLNTTYDTAAYSMPKAMAMAAPPPPPSAAPAPSPSRARGGFLGFGRAPAAAPAPASAVPQPPGASGALFGGPPPSKIALESAPAPSFAKEQKKGGSWLGNFKPGSAGSGAASRADAASAASSSFSATDYSMKKKMSKRSSSASANKSGSISAFRKSSESAEDEDEEANAVTSAANQTPAARLDVLVVLQGFDATWPWTAVLKLMGWTPEQVLAAWTEAATEHGAEARKLGPPPASLLGDQASIELARDLFATALVVVWLRREMAAQRDSWELLVDKAVARLEEDDGAVLRADGEGKSGDVEGLLGEVAVVLEKLIKK
ncbi:von Willebrand factor type A domain-domain-containing protein [Microdochium bolleyi]|uniref:von Willebrand factor type A domain-domain-containing protein n=1 Tax=Microdochium bolleyi TaxID=196109 RepID=A0A136IRS9_9PEZI|nr:von Willebrand factor type A domain-domain-containing protein [Microdochium bolleyi]